MPPTSATAYKFRAKVWLYPGMAGWHFINVPAKQSRQIKDLFGDLAAGWGSLPVRVQLGQTTWQTSIFPDRKTKTYLLPLKAVVRKREGVVAGATVSLFIEIKL